MVSQCYLQDTAGSDLQKSEIALVLLNSAASLGFALYVTIVCFVSRACKETFKAPFPISCYISMHYSFIKLKVSILKFIAAALRTPSIQKPQGKLSETTGLSKKRV